MPDSSRNQAEPAGDSPHDEGQRRVAGARLSTPSRVFGGRGTTFAVLSLALAITLPWAIGFQVLPGLSGEIGATGTLYLAAGPIVISLLFFALIWVLTSSRLREKALALETTRELQESEARFKSVASLSADWYWEQDENYRFTDHSIGGHGWSKPAMANSLGKTRWELSGADKSEQDWAEHRAILDAREPFKNLTFRRSDAGVSHDISVSGEPFFDSQGIFRAIEESAATSPSACSVTVRCWRANRDSAMPSTRPRSGWPLSPSTANGFRLIRRSA